MIISEISKIVEAMQMAVDVVLDSEHERNKVAACVFHPDHPDIPPFAAFNQRPACLKSIYQWDERIGGSSQFLHAELAAIKGFQGPLIGAHICITDPCCPNCAKHIMAAGIRNITIDSKGFEKDFIARNGDNFKSMSMVIAKRAKANVSMINRKLQLHEPILEQKTPQILAPRGVEFYSTAESSSLKTALDAHSNPNQIWVTGSVEDTQGEKKGMLVFEGLPSGFNDQDTKVDIDVGKYRFQVDPLNRYLLTMKRLALHSVDQTVVCSHIPSSRALINALGFGVERIILASSQAGHDPMGQEALEELKKHDLIKVEYMS